MSAPRAFARRRKSDDPGARGERFYRRTDATKCQAEVWDGWHGHPCSQRGVVRVRGRHVCKQHSVKYVEYILRREVGERPT